MRALTLVTIGLLTVTACSRGPDPGDPANYVERVLSHRAAKDKSFRESSDSPVPPDRREEFLPLAYFAPDPAYNVAAVLRSPATPQPVVEMPTSTGLRRQMMKVGSLEFSLKGEALSLSAFVDASTPTRAQLFVPFSDMTTGTESYPGGRYLDLDRTATGIYELDFNAAYHPFCYYDSRYDCPYPPPENRLATPLRAGERLRKN